VEEDPKEADQVLHNIYIKSRLKRSLLNKTQQEIPLDYQDHTAKLLEKYRGCGVSEEMKLPQIGSSRYI
jgi:hypothetical protein